MKWIKTVMMLVILAVAIFAYYSFVTTAPLNKPKVTIAVSKTPLSAPFYIAESLGYFDKSCVEVSITDVIGGKNSFAELMKGKADFATSSGSVIVFEGMSQNNFVSLASFAQSDNDVKIISHAKANIIDSMDMAGHHIGVTKGAAGEYLLSTYLALSGLTFDDIEVSYFSPEELTNALLSEKVDAIVPWEPYAFNTIKQSNNEANTLKTKNLNSLMFNLISHPITNQAQIDQAACVLKALDTAINYISSYPDDAKGIIATRINADVQFIDWVWPDYIFKLSLNRSLLMSLKAQGVWMIESGLVDALELPDYELLLDERALKSVNPLAVRL